MRYGQIRWCLCCTIGGNLIKKNWNERRWCQDAFDCCYTDEKPLGPLVILESVRLGWPNLVKVIMHYNEL